MGVYADVLQEVFLYFTYHGVGRIIDIAHIVLDALTEERVGAPGVQAVIFLEPAQHFRRRMLHRLIERARVADSEDVVLVLSSRPADGLPFAQR